MSKDLFIFIGTVKLEKALHCFNLFYVRIYSDAQKKSIHQ